MPKLPKDSRPAGGISHVLRRKRKKQNQSIDGPAVPVEILEKYARGREKVQRVSKINKIDRAKIVKKEKKVEWAEKWTARAEVLLTEEAGYLEPDDGMPTSRVTQKQIIEAADVTSATKHFDLDLEFGPYRCDYTKNGRFLLVGGRKGHIAAMDWVTKRLLCEMNVMEQIFDVSWLHIETMFAVAQKKWLYMYDNKGVELHCVKNLHNILRMSFLPYHFLLTCTNEDGWVSWLDVSVGQIVNKWNVRKGRLSVMAQNPYNGVVCLGHQNGVVSMWAPTKSKPLAEMLCHKSPVKTVTVDQTGTYMFTGAADGELKVWDIRNFEGPVQHYKFRSPPDDSSFSQRGLLALASGNRIQIFKDCHLSSVSKPYLTYSTLKPTENINFCPYEDVLGIGSGGGFTSILVPGSGEPNYDALEANPFQTKTQRQEAEVKSLLEKVQPELIALDPSSVLDVNLPSMVQRMKAKEKLLNMKPADVDFTPKKKRRGNTARMAKVKKIVRQDRKHENIKQLSAAKKSVIEELKKPGKPQKRVKSFGVLDRFVKKKQKK